MALYGRSQSATWANIASFHGAVMTVESVAAAAQAAHGALDKAITNVKVVAAAHHEDARKAAAKDLPGATVLVVGGPTNRSGNIASMAVLALEAAAWAAQGEELKAAHQVSLLISIAQASALDRVAFMRGLWEDVELLQNTAAHERWSKETGVAPELFEPLPE